MFGDFGIFGSDSGVALSRRGLIADLIIYGHSMTCFHCMARKELSLLLSNYKLFVVFQFCVLKIEEIIETTSFLNQVSPSNPA